MFSLLSSSKRIKKKQQPLLEYTGSLSQGRIEELLTKTEQLILQEKPGDKVLKRIYSVMVEALMNMMIHSPEDIQLTKKHPPTATITKNNGHYIIYFGNMMENDFVNPLIDRINHINSLSRHELKKFYARQVMKARISDKGGAGLGLITIAKFALSNLSYNFDKINQQYSYFRLCIEISKH
jgi:hypothetical protein